MAQQGFLIVFSGQSAVVLCLMSGPGEIACQRKDALNGKVENIFAGRGLAIPRPQ